MTGPNLETRAEYRYLRTIGADVIGMSTIPEVLVAVHQGTKVLGFSIVTDMCFPDSLEPVSIDEIIAVANAAEAKLARLVVAILEKLKP
jgi:purine-nucleoside phosphorylase